MQLYGYIKDDNDDTILNLSEVTLKVTPTELRNIAEFFLRTAELMDKHGAAFGHEHFRDYIGKPTGKIEGDLIIVR